MEIQLPGLALLQTKSGPIPRLLLSHVANIQSCIGKATTYTAFEVAVPQESDVGVLEELVGTHLILQQDRFHVSEGFASALMDSASLFTTTNQM